MSLIRVSKRVDGSWTCPSEGSFYACASGSRFVGCCTADPCTNGCPDGNMQPVGFNSDNHGTFPDASCGAASQFYTCASGNQTFWGCCKSNPCAQGQTCPAADLTPAFMDRPEQLGAYVTGVSSTTSATSSPTASRTPTPGSDDDDGGSNIGAIVGGTVGGVLGLAIIGAVLIFILRKRKQQKDNSPGKPGSAGSSNAAYDAVPSGEKNNKNLRASTFADAPPVYTSPNPNTYSNPQSGYPTYAQYSEPQSQEIQELPADMSQPAHAPRFSELPAGAAARTATAELESPAMTPRTPQTGFKA